MYIKGRIKSPVYRRWEREALWMIKIDAGGVTFDAPVAIAIRVPYNPRRDLDNYMKVTIDALVTAGVIVDDNMKRVPVKSIRVDRSLQDEIRVAIKLVDE
jgi:Holliday junction resolvase RusA-like endonuclease